MAGSRLLMFKGVNLIFVSGMMQKTGITTTVPIGFIALLKAGFITGFFHVHILLQANYFLD